MLVIGHYFTNLICESFLDPETNRIRVRPLPDQGVPANVVIECSRSEREAHPLGTVFYCEDAKVCQKPDGRIYLRAKDQMIYRM